MYNIHMRSYEGLLQSQTDTPLDHLEMGGDGIGVHLWTTGGAGFLVAGAVVSSLVSYLSYLVRGSRKELGW